MCVISQGRSLSSVLNSWVTHGDFLWASVGAHLADTPFLSQKIKRSFCDASITILFWNGLLWGFLTKKAVA